MAETPSRGVGISYPHAGVPMEVRIGSRSGAERQPQIVDPESQQTAPVYMPYGAAMQHAIRNRWKAAIAMEETDVHDLIERFAHGRAYGITVLDVHGRDWREAINRDGQHLVVERAREIRATDTGVPNGLTLVFRQLAIAMKGPGRFAFRLVGMFALLIVALGYQWLAAIVGAVAAQPSILIVVVRIVAGAWLVGWLVSLWPRSEPRLTPASQAAPEVPVGAHAIENFRLQNPFGDAALARKREIAEALTGRADGFSPRFEN